MTDGIIRQMGASTWRRIAPGATGPTQALIIALLVFWISAASNPRLALSESVPQQTSTNIAIPTDWPTPRFVPEGTGFNPYEGVLSATNVGTLQVAWSADSGGFLYGTPIVVDGVVYVTGHIGVTGAGALYAFDAASGTLLWKTKGSGEPPSDPTVAGGKVYVSFLFAHTLRVYDAANGDMLWSFPGPTFTPTVANGVVYAADDLHSLWAIDAQSGRKLWVAHSPLGGYGFGLAVADGVVYVGGHAVGGGAAPVYAYDAATGALLWRTKTRAGVLGTPAVASGTVFVGSDVLSALDAKTGRVRWTVDAGGGIDSSAAVANGWVYVGSEDHNVYAFAAQTGDLLWVAPTEGNITAGQAVIVANGVVYVGSIDHSFYAFDAATGDELWSYQTGDAARKESVVNGTLYATSFDSRLYAFRLPSHDPS